jgi:hypothetical protein
MLREPFPAELGLTNLGFAILENLVSGIGLGILDASPSEIDDELSALRVRRLISSVDESTTSIGSSTENVTVLTPEGCRLASTLVREGEFVVFFHLASEIDGQPSVHPILCRVVEDVPKESESAKIWFSAVEINQGGKAVCADYAWGTVSINLLMRMEDYFEQQPVCHADDVPYFREHNLGEVYGHGSE